MAQDDKSYPDTWAINNEIDIMNKELQNMKEVLTKHSLKCHILEIDLATQFSPDIQQALRESKQECLRCSTAIKKIQATQKDKSEAQNFSKEHSAGDATLVFEEHSQNNIEKQQDN